MGCLGVHYGLTDAEVAKLRSYEYDSERLDYLYEDLEENFWSDHPEFVAETDKAWDGIHRALTDGHLDYGQGVYPLSHVIMGGERLYFSDDHIMVLKSRKEVQDAADALRAVTKDTFRAGYFRIDTEECGYRIDEEDFDYTWHWFEKLREFWVRAADGGRFVLFSASQ